MAESTTSTNNAVIETDFSDFIDTAVIQQGLVSKKGNKYDLVLITLTNGTVLRYLLSRYDLKVIDDLKTAVNSN